MVDIEYLRKNCIDYDACITEYLRDIRDRYEDYSYYDGFEEGAEEIEEEPEDIKKEIYGDLIYLLACFRIMGIDFSGCDFKKDIDSTLQHIEKMKKEGIY